MLVILVDTFGYFFRSYYALPPLQNSKHFPTSLLTGFSHFVFNLYKDNPNTCIIFALEGKGINRRKEIYPLYKANRQEAPQDLLLQLPVAIEWLDKMQIPQACVDGYEADDCIASLAKLATSKNLDVEIISHDKDLYQLIDDRVCLFDYTRKQRISYEECHTKFGVMPKDFITYQSIVGDSSDNIPGIKGIGPKGAVRILEHFNNLDSIYSALESNEQDIVKIFGKRIAGLIKEHKDMAYLSRNLVTLRTDLFDEYDFSLSQNNNNLMPLLKIQHELREYELNKILLNLKRYDTKLANSNTTSKSCIANTHTNQFGANEFNYIAHLITDSKELFDILKSIPKDCIIAYDCETNGLNVRQDRIIGFSFCFDGLNGYYVPIAYTLDEIISSKDSIQSLLNYAEDINLQNSSQSSNESNNMPKRSHISKQDAKMALEIIFSHPIIGHNLKFDIGMAWHNFGVKPACSIRDSMVLAWLLDSNRSVSLDNLMQEHFNHKMIAFSDIVPKNATFDSIDIELASKYASEDAVATYVLYYKLESICSKEILEVATNLEFPFIFTLCYMEDWGIRVNKEHFLSLRHEFTKNLHSLQQQIYKQCNFEFNINSPKQLAEVLFTRLGLDTSNNKSLGTNESVLTKLIDSHPVISTLLEYREVFKLFSTYIEPILELSKTQDRIHTQFIQTGTNTGRLSSKSPNLQNIPVRTKLGRRIRAGFEADKGNVLVSLDYSQIELRLLAHFSKDYVLLESFHNNADIHAKTASKIFKDDFDNANENSKSEFRAIAKSINFGLIYGMGARKLSATLGISNAKAKEYIKQYFDSFPSVKQYLESKKEEIMQNSYATTLLGRRRFFDFFNATEFMRQNFLREGVNSIFQGSAADLIKLSMNAIMNHKAFLGSGSNLKAKMLLQIHDELIFEIGESSARDIASDIKDIMEHIYPLEVPLVCNISIGKTWADLK
ncbi:DNA polymerase I [Helicobacter muridarum]|uniref:DNA polymerase I n=1 Tax=Helicobacter muridarum TaxID=216 RepID=A0A099TWK3_9HELI|nr:DNA polymerase I [Helicobacter muridarum]TLD98114.1 DNA polymerase I [Helicobacter muridarum]STQ86398.1 DNA polymerase I [Helicobacter muridarum]